MSDEDPGHKFKSPSNRNSVFSRIGFTSTPIEKAHVGNDPKRNNSFQLYSPSEKHSSSSHSHSQSQKRANHSIHNSSYNSDYSSGKSFNESSYNSGYNSSPATTPQGRDNKAGWYDIHDKHVSLTSYSKTVVVLSGDSIVAGLSRYSKVWGNYFKPLKALNFGIGGDRTQHVLWRAENMNLPETVKYVVLHCGTNNIDRDPPLDIANGIISIGLTYQEKQPGLKVIVTGLLPRDLKWSARRDKIIKTNNYLKKLCQHKLRDFYFMKQDSDWTLENGDLNEELYYTDCLHLIETGNVKFAKSIISILHKVIANEEIVYSDDEDENESSFHFYRKHGEERGKRKRSSSPEHKSGSRKRRRSNSEDSQPKHSHRSPFKWTKDGESKLHDNTPNKWSGARNWSKVIRKEFHDKYSETDSSHADNTNEETRRRRSPSPGNNMDNVCPEGTAKSIDISLDDERRKAARRAKFGESSVKIELDKLSAGASNTPGETGSPSALVLKIRESMQQARHELSQQKKQRRQSLVGYSSPSSQDDSQEEATFIPAKLNMNKFLSDYASGSESE